MNRRRSSIGVIKWDSLTDPGPRFQLGDRIGSGVCADVYEAQDLQDGRQVAIKIENISEDNMDDIDEEYQVLSKLSQHPNLPDFYGAYRKKGRDSDQIWFVMELCEGGSASELVRALQKADKKLSELHLAYILREVIKAIIHLHENYVMHRDIRGSNILFKNGEIRLVDYGLAREVSNTAGKRSTSIGSPSWMAPEVVSSESKGGSVGTATYDNRVDVWALGITAIELAEGKAPFENIHPTRALFQIVRNPPPTLFRPANWSQMFNDFIAECLEKNPENRPFIMELVEHPFLKTLPENDVHLPNEIKTILETVTSQKREPYQEVMVRANYLKASQSSEPETMYLEDLAALSNVNEDSILEQLQQRLKRGAPYTFMGDVLLFLNPNDTQQSMYSEQVRPKYNCKSRSDNVPHIFSVADGAYQDVLHHEEAQHIVLGGESLSGKTTNMMHLLGHLLWLGKGYSEVCTRIQHSMTVIHTIGNACTPLNANSTRHVLHTYLTYTYTGKTSGAIFWLYQLERWRVTTDDKRQGNFHLFYEFYDAMSESGSLDKYSLDSGRRYRLLRPTAAPNPSLAGSVPSDPASAANNVSKYKIFVAAFKSLEFGDENIETVNKVVAAILNLGEVRFRDCGGGVAEIENPRAASHVARLLEVEEKKFTWALVNYCVVDKGQAVKRRQSPEEAEEARDALARALYARLTDWIINLINLKLSFSRAVYGDRHMISILDLFGFECYHKNTMEQLLVNSLNEQLQYHYTQQLFAWEMQERDEDDVRSAEPLTYYNNRPTVDLLMSKPDGIMWVVDQATSSSEDVGYIMGAVKKSRSPFVQVTSNHEFTVAHYTGKVTYDVSGIPEKNRDFVPPEITETLRLSNNKSVKDMFTNPLSRTGNLTQASMDIKAAEEGAPKSSAAGSRSARGNKWGAVLMADKQQRANRKYNTLSRGQFSQTRRIRTVTASYRAVCLELLRTLRSGGTHFVRCLRAELTGQPRGFQREVVRQQMRALSVVDTVRGRQNGFPCRVPFSEFLRRYKFLAFDFDENVEETGDNCRLLMVRLKMEGYVIGKTKVFLKYYHEEYLARLYELQVKKIVKVQAMLRAFIAKKRIINAGSKAPGSLAGLTDKSDGKPPPDDASDDTMGVDERRAAWRRNPLASVIDYLVDDD